MADQGSEDPAASVGQFDICECIGDLLQGQPVSTTELVETARARGARPAVLDTLRHLPHHHYEHFSDLIADLAHLPRAVDPWDRDT